MKPSTPSVPRWPRSHPDARCCCPWPSKHAATRRRACAAAMRGWTSAAPRAPASRCWPTRPRACVRPGASSRWRRAATGSSTWAHGSRAAAACSRWCCPPGPGAAARALQRAGRAARPAARPCRRTQRQDLHRRVGHDLAHAHPFARRRAAARNGDRRPAGRRHASAQGTGLRAGRPALRQRRLRLRCLPRCVVEAIPAALPRPGRTEAARRGVRGRARRAGPQAAELQALCHRPAQFGRLDRAAGRPRQGHRAAGRELHRLRRRGPAARRAEPAAGRARLRLALLRGQPPARARLREPAGLQGHRGAADALARARRAAADDRRARGQPLRGPAAGCLARPPAARPPRGGLQARCARPAVGQAGRMARRLEPQGRRAPDGPAHRHHRRPAGPPARRRRLQPYHPDAAAGHRRRPQK